jgi:hypothetical protein
MEDHFPKSLIGLIARGSALEESVLPRLSALGVSA